MRLGAIEGGGTKFVLAVADELGNIEKRVRISTVDPKTTLNQVIDFFKNEDVQAIGFGSFGPIDLDTSSSTYGEILESPKTLWKNFNVLDYLQSSLNIPIFLETDVNLACLGEVTFGDSKGLENVLYITIGTGIGVGAYINNQIYHGVSHSEMGHILIKRNDDDNFLGVCPYHHDCFEGLASGPAIEQRYHTKGEHLINNEEVWNLIGEYVAKAIINYTYTLVPQRIILGGGVGQNLVLLKAVKQKFKELNKNYVSNNYTSNLDSYIQIASLKDNAGIIGCLEAAKLHLKNLDNDQDVLFLSGPLKERIWGGDYFNKVLNLTNSLDKFGELWSCSAHQEGESIILNSRFKGEPLSEIYHEHPELFNFPKIKDFPILVKLIATTDDLSVQVHPDDEYAKINHNQMGKTEGWLILSSNNSKIVIGHNAKDKEQLSSMIKNDDYKHLLNEKQVQVGEFYPINAGTIHALGKNLVILEIQQSSDITYRLFDYHRKDKNGKERELHIKQAIDVTRFDHEDVKTKNYFDITDTEVLLWDNDYFQVILINVNKKYQFKNTFNYAIMTIADGEVFLKNRLLHQGDSFIVTALCKDFTIYGNGKVVMTISKL